MQALPVIVGFGGYNAAGRSSSHQAFRRLVLESLSQEEQEQTIVSLACLMKLVSWNNQFYEDYQEERLTQTQVAKKYKDLVLKGTLIRRLEDNLFDPKKVYGHKRVVVESKDKENIFFKIAKRDLPSVTCWGTGSPFREFMHVDDLGEAVIFVLRNWNPDSENAPKDKEGNPRLLLNVGTGKDLSIKKLATTIAELTNFKGNIIWDKTKPDGTPKKLLNIENIRKIGWEPKIDLIEGITKTIKDFQNENIDSFT